MIYCRVGYVIAFGVYFFFYIANCIIEREPLMRFYVILGSWAIMTGNVFIKKYDFFLATIPTIFVLVFICYCYRDKVESSYIFWHTQENAHVILLP